eukprot:7378917-Prymnesium_polylepis.2
MSAPTLDQPRPGWPPTENQTVALCLGGRHGSFVCQAMCVTRAVGYICDGSAEALVFLVSTPECTAMACRLSEVGWE